MSRKKYYAEREGNLTVEKYDFNMLKRLFLHMFNKLNEECYFQEAFGYHCTDGDRIGKLGTDIDAEIYLQTGLQQSWPIREFIHYYDEVELFTVIEFLFQNISAPRDRYYHSWNDCGYHATVFNKEDGKVRFLDEINKLLSNYEGDYHLSKEGEIRNNTPDAYEELLSEAPTTDEPSNVDERISYAISKYFHFSSGLNEKKDAVRTLADVLEFYKKQGIKLTNRDDSDLFNIINGFDIRHHNQIQQGSYNKEIWYEWMFYSFLSSIRAIQKFNEII